MQLLGLAQEAGAGADGGSLPPQYPALPLLPLTCLLSPCFLSPCFLPPPASPPPPPLLALQLLRRDDVVFGYEAFRERLLYLWEKRLIEHHGDMHPSTMVRRRVHTRCAGLGSAAW